MKCMQSPRIWLPILAWLGGCHAETIPGSSAIDSSVDGTTSDAPRGAGIAAKYPGDVGIGSDTRVILFENFESRANAMSLLGDWTATYNSVSITSTADNVFSGNKAVQFELPISTEEVGTGIAKDFGTKYDVIYLRYYSKLETNFNVVGSSHNGVDISAGYYVNGNATPGVPADGTNKYLIAYENWRGNATDKSPGFQNIYIYHPLQRDKYGDHFFPNGEVMPNTSLPFDFGPTFIKRPQFTPKLGQWYAFEVMLKANTPGKLDGQVTCWVDGNVIADFPNLRLRDTDALKIDRIGIGLHANPTNPTLTHKWADNIVVATDYIGPMAPRP